MIHYFFFANVLEKIEIGEKMGPMLGQVMGYMQQNNIQSSGMPFTIYNNIDEANGSVIFSAAIPIKDTVPLRFFNGLISRQT